MLSYCSTLCPDIMSAQMQLSSAIWAICTENDQCPTVISSSAILNFLFYPHPLIINLLIHKINSEYINNVYIGRGKEHFKATPTSLVGGVTIK